MYLMKCPPIVFTHKHKVTTMSVNPPSSCVTKHLNTPDIIQLNTNTPGDKSNQFYSYCPKSQSHSPCGLYNLYSERRPLSSDLQFQ